MERGRAGMKTFITGLVPINQPPGSLGTYAYLSVAHLSRRRQVCFY